MEYLDFELRVGPGAGREYPVEVLRSPVGEAAGTMRFPFDTLALENRLQAVQIAVLRSTSTRRDIALGDDASTPAVADFGRQLFESLMAAGVRDSFRRSQDRARAQGKGLRLRLRIEDPALATLPWEYLYDPTEREYVALSSDTPVVRYLEVDQPAEPMRVEPPLSILGVVASPSDRPTLDVARERQRVETATASLREAGLLQLTWLDGSTWRALQRAMRHGPYHVLHFVGHGGFDAAAGEGVVALTDDDGRSALLTATQLGRLLCDHRSLRLAVLNSCLGAKGSGTDVLSSTAATLIRRGVPAVIAMQYEISDTAAVEFARSLYEALAEGVPVDAAVSEARKAMSFAASNTVEWGTPVLHMRSPDGVLFAIDATAARAARETREQRARLDTMPNVAPNVTPNVVPNAAPNAAPNPAPNAAPRRTGRVVAVLGALVVAGGAAVALSRRAPAPVPAPTPAPAPLADTARAAPRADAVPPAPREAAVAPTSAPRAVPRAVVMHEITATESQPGLPFTPMGAVVRTLTFAGQGGGDWTLRLHVEHPVTNGVRVGTIRCRLRAEDDPESLVVPVPFRLDGRGPSDDFTATFHLARPWAMGTYPAVCTSQRGERVFTGTMTVR